MPAVLRVRVATRGLSFPPRLRSIDDDLYKYTQLAGPVDGVMVTPVAAYTAPSVPVPTRSTAPTRTLQPAPVGSAVRDDSVTVSAAGRQPAGDAAADQAGGPGAAPRRATGVPGPGTPVALDTTEQRVLQALRQRDQEVRLHEQAHLAAAGPYARGGPSYTYQTGPDGRRYAVGGEVPIDLSPVPGDPQATLRKAHTLRRAALAPAHPSAADQAVAARAAALAVQARQELRQLPGAGRPATQPAAAGRTETAGEATAAATTAVTPSPRHICGPNCQNHGTGPIAGTRIPAPAHPITSVTSALQSYRVAAP